MKTLSDIIKHYEQFLDPTDIDELKAIYILYGDMDMLFYESKGYDFYNDSITFLKSFGINLRIEFKIHLAYFKER